MKNYYLSACRFIVLLCLAAMGPYVVPAAGLRLEHFVIYGTFLWVIVLKTISGRNAKKDRNVFLLLGLCFAAALWVSISTLKNLSWATPYGVLAGLENFIQPIALIVVIISVMDRLERVERLNLLRVAGIATIVMLCINAFIAALSMFYDLWPFLEYFVVGELDLENGLTTLSQVAATGGRLLGVFNQPAESGLAYSIALLIWAYLATISKRINLIGGFSLILLLIGGFLSISKTFMFGGFPLSILYYIWTGPIRFRIRINTLITVSSFGLGMVVVLSLLADLLAESWKGFEFFLRYFNLAIFDNGIFEVLDLLTGSRFGNGESGVGLLFAKAWMEAPIMGFGVANAQGLDNGFLEFFFYGGIVGLAFHIALLLVILWVAFVGLRSDPNRGRLLFTLWILIIGASIGAPAITLNRASIFLWIILIITFGVLSKRMPYKHIRLQSTNACVKR